MNRLFPAPLLALAFALPAQDDPAMPAPPRPAPENAKLDVLPTDDLLSWDREPVFHFDPCLLDAAGQLVGYWPIEYCTEGFVLFPIRINQLTVYGGARRAGERPRIDRCG